MSDPDMLLEIGVSDDVRGLYVLYSVLPEPLRILPTAARKSLRMRLLQMRVGTHRLATA